MDDNYRVLLQLSCFWGSQLLIISEASLETNYNVNSYWDNFSRCLPEGNETQSLLNWPELRGKDTSTSEHHFSFGPVASFFLELLLMALQSSNQHIGHLLTYGESGRGSSSSVISFCLFILPMGFSRQEDWSGLPFPPPADHVWSELFTMTGST